MIIKLNKNQFDYLSYSYFETQKGLEFKLNQISEENKFFIEVGGDTANAIHNWANDELQKKGFDINYELTSEGKLLEELIDIFYIE